MWQLWINLYMEKPPITITGFRTEEDALHYLKQFHPSHIHGPDYYSITKAEE